MFDLSRRLYRPTYYPQWGDAKHRQALASASRRVFGEDLTYEILKEVQNRQLRSTSRAKGPQPWVDAEAKVWRDLARRRGVDPAEIKSLEVLVRRIYRNRGA